MVSPIADFVVDVGSDGRILSQGTLENALAHDSSLLKDVEHEAEELQKADQEIDGEKEEDVNAQSSAGKLVVAEEIEHGHVGWRACKQILRSFILHSDGGGLSVAVPWQHVDTAASFLVYLCYRICTASLYHERSGAYQRRCGFDILLICVVYPGMVARRVGGAVRNYSSRRGACPIVSEHLNALCLIV